MAIYLKTIFVFVCLIGVTFVCKKGVREKVIHKKVVCTKKTVKGKFKFENSLEKVGVKKAVWGKRFL